MSDPMTAAPAPAPLPSQDASVTKGSGPTADTTVQQAPGAGSSPAAGAVFHDPSMPFITAIVHKSAREGVAWQGTIMGPEGPAQHIEAASREAVVSQLEGAGFKAGSSPAAGARFRAAVKVLTTQGVDEQTAGSVAPLLAQSLPEGIGMEEFRDRVLSEFAAIGGVLPNSVPKRYVEQAAAYEAQGFTPEQAAENARNSQAANQEDVDAANAQNATVRRGLTNLQGGNRSNAGSSTLPGEAAAALVSMAQTALRAGQNFAQWAASMVQRFGEAVRQYLQGAWQAATQTSEVGALNFTSALGPQLQAAANNRQPRSTTVNNRQLLTTAHAAAARGSSTQMVPIRRVYEEARRQNPALTPEQFQAQVMAEYEAGTVLLEGSGSRQEAESAGLRIDGTPVGTAVRMMVVGNPALQNPASGATRAAGGTSPQGFTNLDPGARTGGFLNTEILAEGAALLQQGFTTFANWSKAMLSRFGEAIRQYLAGVWQHALRASEVGAINPQGTGKRGGLLQRTKAQTKAGRTVGTSNPTSAQRTGEGTDANHNVELSRLRENNPEAYRKNALLLTRYPLVAREQPELAGRMREIDQPVEKAQASVDAANAALKSAKYAVQKAVGEVLKKKTAKVKAAEVDAFLEANPGKRLTGAVRKQQGIVAAQAAKLDQAKKRQAQALKELLSSQRNVTVEKADAIYESYITAVESNLETLINLFPKKLRDIARLWYDGANIIAQNFGRRFGATLEQSSAVLAVFSPQKDWFMNVSLAERMMGIWKNDQDTVWSKAMTEQFIMRSGEPQPMEDKKTGEIIYDQNLVDEWNPEGIKYQKGARPGAPDANGNTTWINWDNDKAADAVAAARVVLASVEGRSLRDISQSKHKSRFIRMLSEVRDSPHYAKVSPDGQFGGLMTNDKGVKVKIAWGGYNTIEKAISIMQATTENEHAVISEALGEQHKVRSFYNNIADPANTSGHVTMDTHAVAALLWLPLSGASVEVTQNFGSAGVQNDGGAGIKGMYAANAEAYRRAGAAFGLLPREVQSITWEAVRLLFPAKWKSSKANVAKVRAVWDRFLNHELSIEQARAAVFGIATEGRNLDRAIKDGSGVGNPSWSTDMGDRAPDPGGSQEADDAGELSANRGTGGPGSGRGAGGSGRERGGRDRAAVVSPAPTGRLGGFTNLDPGARTGGFLNAEILAEGAALLQQGFTTFANWSKAMLSRFGQGIRDALTAIWQQITSPQTNAAQNVRMGRAQGSAPVTLGQGGFVTVSNGKVQGMINAATRALAPLLPLHVQGTPFRVKNLGLRSVLTGSPLPPELVGVLDMTENERQAVMQASAQIGRDVESGVNAQAKRTGRRLADIWNEVNAIMEGVPGAQQRMRASDPELAESSRRARNMLDDLSAAVAQTLPAGTLLDTITQNVGQWMRRGYAAFDAEANWNFDSVTKAAAAGKMLGGKDARKILADARAYLRSQNPQAGRTMAEWNGDIEADMRDLMDRDQWEAAMADGSTVRKGVSSFMKRKDIAPEIRALMGEETNPLIRYARSAKFQAQIVARHHGQIAMRNLGLTTGLFSTERGGVYTTQMPVDTRWSGMAGVWTTPQLMKAFQETSSTDLAGKDIGGMLVNSLKALGNEAKLNKVALNPGSWVVNILGNVVAVVQSGDVFYHDFVRRVNEARGIVGSGKTLRATNGAALALQDAQRSMLQRLRAAGVTGSSITLSDIEASLPRHLLAWAADDAKRNAALGAAKGAIFGQSLGRVLAAPGRIVGGAIGGAIGARVGVEKIQAWQQAVANYVMTGPDALARVTGWLTNYETALASGLTTEQANVQATQKTLNTFPNYAALPALLRSLSRIGFAGSFIAFQYEVWRNYGWNVKYAVEEINSGNAAQRGRGLRRLAGLTAVSSLAMGGLGALLTAAGLASGADDERNKLFRKWFGRPWEKDAVLAFSKFDGDKVAYYNTSYLLPQVTMVEVAQAMIEGESPEDKASRVISRLWEQFAASSVHLGPLIEAYTGQTRDGFPISQRESAAGRAMDQVDYLVGSTMESGFSAQFERVARALMKLDKHGRSYTVEGEIKYVAGVREQTREWEKIVQQRYGQFSRDYNAARTQAKNAISENAWGAKPAAIATANERIGRLQTELATYEKDMARLGISRAIVLRARKNSGLQKLRPVRLTREGNSVEADPRAPLVPVR
jgi:hypothetical protein